MSENKNENENENEVENKKVNESQFDDFNSSELNKFVSQYGGAVIGGLIALILCFTKLYKILVFIVIVLAGIIIGNYVQKNKSTVKEKLKHFIDKF